MRWKRSLLLFFLHYDFWLHNPFVKTNLWIVTTRSAVLPSWSSGIRDQMAQWYHESQQGTVWNQSQRKPLCACSLQHWNCSGLGSPSRRGSFKCKCTIRRSNQVSSISLAVINNLAEISFSDLLWRRVLGVTWLQHLSPTDCQVSSHLCTRVCLKLGTCFTGKHQALSAQQAIFFYVSLTCEEG